MTCILTRRCNRICFTLRPASLRRATWGMTTTSCCSLIQQINSGEIAGPRITPNGFLEGKSPYSARTGFVAESLADALRDVRWYADRGYFQIKIYNSMNPDWVKPIADEAHHLGMTVTGHVPAFDTPDRAIHDGYNEITHINQLMLGWLLKPGEDTRTPLRLTAMARAATLDLSSAPVQNTLSLMKANHIAHDPTAVIVERLMLSRAGTVQPGDLDYLDHMPIAYQRYRRRTFVPIHNQAEDDAYRAGFRQGDRYAKNAARRRHSFVARHGRWHGFYTAARS